MIQPSDKSWQVIVSNVGSVYSGSDEGIARDVFDTYVRMSQKNHSKVVNQEVSLICGETIIESYFPPIDEDTDEM